MLDELDLDPYQPLVETHEAGHVVAAASFGIPFAYTTSRSFGGMKGHLLPRMSPALERAIETDDRRVMEKIAIVSACGPLAEGVDPTGEDLGKMLAFAPDRDLVPILAEALDFVHNYAPEIKRVAAALALAGTLTEDAVLELV